MESKEENSDTEESNLIQSESTTEDGGMFTKSNLITFFVLFTNFVSSIAIVLCNKSLYTDGGLPPIFLASFQFFCTFLGLLVLAVFQVFQVKKTSLLKILPLCAAFCSFVVFSNLSLKYNTVGTYQLIKCLSDPLTFFLQVKLYGKTYSTRVKITLAIIVLGIAVNYFTDVRINVLGGVCGLVAVVASSLYYTWIGAKQEELKLTPIQLLFYQSSLSSVMLVLASLCYELGPVVDFWTTFERSKLELFILSGAMALAVNLSVFYIIRRTSVITYAVFCKLKICLVIWGGYVFFGETMTLLQSSGTVVTLTGTFIYTFLKNRESEKSIETPEPPTENLKKETPKV